MSAPSTTVFEDRVNVLATIRDELAAIQARIKELEPMPEQAENNGPIKSHNRWLTSFLPLDMKDLLNSMDNAIAAAAMAGGITDQESL